VGGSVQPYVQSRKKQELKSQHTAQWTYQNFCIFSKKLVFKNAVNSDVAETHGEQGKRK